MTPQPYYADATVALYHGDCRQVLPELGLTFDACVADPPYAETELSWDHWPTGWLDAVAHVTRSLWCFGSLSMFMSRAPEFAAAGWRLSHDKIGETDTDTRVWEKHNGSGPGSHRRPVRVHEPAGHFYRGRWSTIYADLQREQHGGPKKAVHRRTQSALSRAPYRDTAYGGPSSYQDDGLRTPRSVVRVQSMHGRAVHPTQKPTALVAPMIEYVAAAGSLVLDPVAGSGTTGIAAKLTGRRAVLIEAHEPYCEVAARRLDQGVLDLGEPA